MVIVTTCGRSDLKDFFETGIHSGGDCPFLVFDAKAREVKVCLESSIDDVLKYPDSTRVMKQWPGQWRSDFFQFSVKELRDYHDAESNSAAKELLKATSIKVVVLRSMRVESMNVEPFSKDLPFLPAGEMFMLALKSNPSVVFISLNQYGPNPPMKFSGKEWLKSYKFNGTWRRKEYSR